MRIILITAALIALPALAACGNDDKPAPAALTQADIAKSLRDKGLQDQRLADCAAKIYVDEGISQSGLRTMISNEYDSKAADPETLGMTKTDADKARTATGKIVKECIEATRR